MKVIIALIVALLSIAGTLEAKQIRTYKQGGTIRTQNSYVRKSTGKMVAPHLKTRPDNTKINNLNQWK